MDAITLLKEDHRTVEGLFRRFERSSNRQTRTAGEVVTRIIEELSRHAAIEEQAFYPAVRKAMPDVEDDILEALEEHHVVKWTLSELDGMQPSDERFEAKVTVLMESVRHHVREEERELFPEVRRAMGRTQLAELGAKMEKLKKTAPSRPHPRTPDTPPGNLVAGAVSGGLDKARETGRRTLARSR